MTSRVLLLASLLLMFTLVPGCGPPREAAPTSATAPPETQAALTIVSGSENKTLEPLIQRFAASKNVRIAVEYKGSVDIMLALQDTNTPYDAVWPANSLWISLGDTHKRVKHSQSIMRSPIVFAVKKSLATRFGWVGKPVRVEDILKQTEGGRLRWMMTSATQSNSGACFYLGCLYAFSGQPDVLSVAQINNPATAAKTKAILGSVNRSAGSTGFLKDLFVEHYDDYDGMVTYEALLIETNQAMQGKTQDPLYAVYPTDGLTFADSPLGFISKGDAAKEQLFQELQAYLLSAEAQRQILAQGRRVGLGAKIVGGDPAVFNPSWGIDAGRTLSPIRLPEAAVIKQALDLYQTAFRKPSLNIYVLDYSGSMEGERIDSLKSAMGRILDQSRAGQYFLQASSRDVNVVIPFSSSARGPWSVRGNNPDQLGDLLARINREAPSAGTALYSAVEKALDTLQTYRDREKYLSAIILLTDGESNQGDSFQQLQAHARNLGFTRMPPIFAMRIGEASETQLKDLVSWTSGRFFGDTKDLSSAFREVKGYN
ncbi:MAG TPA: VWA domain-containing protein [Armatimonadota bacterium]|jgi:Ca-activated chloride channel family protein